MATGQTGYQPRNTPAERRAFFDLQRRLKELEDSGGSGGGGGTDEVWIGPSTPTDPNIELWYDTDAGMPPPIDVPVAYTHAQGTPATTWTITHNLGWYPNVAIVDSSGAQVEGDITYVNVNTVSATFSAAFSGAAYLS
jgi:hypothetical protein